MNQQVSSGSRPISCTRVKSLDSAAGGLPPPVPSQRRTLFMAASVWRGNAMKTLLAIHSSRSAQPVKAASPSASPFVLDATASNRFCLVGIANTDRTGNRAEDFRTYDEFVVWVHQNPGVWSATSTIIGTTKTNYEQLDGEGIRKIHRGIRILPSLRLTCP